MRKLLTASFIFLYFSSFAQRENIVSFTDKLVITSVLNTKSEDFSFSNEIGQSLEFSTAPITTLGLGIDYKWFTFEYGKRLGSSSEDGLYGHTENFGIGFGFTMPKWYFRNFLEQYTGYHITNPDLVQIGYLDSIGSYPYRGDVQTTKYFATFNWVFNNQKYSSMASLWQLERQEKSAGSLVAGVSVSWASARADSSFIPGVQQPNFPEVRDWKEIYVGTYTLNVGYQYTFVLSNSKKWFIHLGLNPGFGLATQSVVDESYDYFSQPNQFALTTEGRFIVGYNGDKWYYGFTSLGYTQAKANEVSVQSSFNSYNRLYLGYRFTLPKKTTEFLEKIWL